jgi:hypothetical protein
VYEEFLKRKNLVGTAYSGLPEGCANRASVPAAMASEI